ncbi:MAG: M3 family metallopeptidase [Bacteroidales bacterium]
MKRFSYLIVAGMMMFASCNNQAPKEDAAKEDVGNPFLVEYNTPYQVPPFDQIKIEHYIPAFKEAFKQHDAEIDAIIKNQEEPSFENTILAMEKAGSLLNKIEGTFGNMSNALTGDEFKKMEEEASPLLSAHYDNINLNPELFNRIKKVYDNREALNLNKEQSMLLDKVYKSMVRGGALLEESKKARFKEINSELGSLSLKFGSNILAETNNYELVITDKKDLAGLPEGVIAAAADEAKNRGKEGSWVFTLNKPSMIPFLTYADKRELRKEIHEAYCSRCDHNNEYDNKEIIKKMVNLRVERAHLLGYDSHANYVLEKNMVNTPAKAYDLMDQVWAAALPYAQKEAEELQKMIDQEGGDFKLAPHDWWYYSEKVKKAKYDLNEEMIRPYFKLDNVRDGAFAVANKLYGIKFIERNDIPKYHKDVQVFEIQEADGKHVGIFYMDWHPRASKRSGAWMESYRKQSRFDGKTNVSPVICNVCNFSKPAGDMPALLTVDEVQTLFHEFGHGLHGFLSNCQYNSLSGTAVPRDFVELPSQIMENWSLEPEVLKMFAKHYKTGEIISDELIAKIEKSGKFNQGFTTVEALSAALLDMDFHSMTEVDPNFDVTAFENNSLKKRNMLNEIVVRYRSPYFAHIFAGGYSSGYYAYTYSALLDADAFAAFKEAGIFNKELASKFRNELLSRGGTDKAMNLYINFRGQEPTVEALLKRKGFIQ